MPDPVRLAPELDKPPMVDDPVYHGGRHLVIAEHRAPPAELQVRRDQHRLALVGVGEDLEHQPRALGIERQESEFVDDEKPRPAYLRGLPVQPSLLPCAPQPRDERGRREEPRLDPPLACERAERRGHVGLPGPDIAHQDQVLAGIKECVPSSKNRQIRLSNFDTLMLTASGRAGAVAAGPPAA